MADTTWIKTELEPYVRNWLSLQYPGHLFLERAVPLQGGGGHSFDAVSEDLTIVGNVLSNRARTASGNENTGGVRKALNDLTTLRLVTAACKLMVFTDAAFMELIRRRAEKKGGLVGMTLLLCDLPAAVSTELARVLDSASSEQRSRGQ
jgi:hypothetical protein